MDPICRVHFERWHAEKVKERYHFLTIIGITTGEGSECMGKLVLMHLALDKSLSLLFMDLSGLTGRRVMDDVSKIL